MKQRFILVVQGATPAQRDAITQRFKNSTVFNWWHWMEDVWLFTTYQNYTPRGISDWLAKTPGWNASTKHLILNTNTQEYWGNIVREAWPWFESTWKSP